MMSMLPSSPSSMEGRASSVLANRFSPSPTSGRRIVVELFGINYRVQFWTDEEFDASPEDRRPKQTFHLDGGGYAAFEPLVHVGSVMASA
jgi:hypothetical protein